LLSRHLNFKLCLNSTRHHNALLHSDFRFCLDFMSHLNSLLDLDSMHYFEFLQHLLLQRRGRRVSAFFVTLHTLEDKMRKALRLAADLASGCNLETVTTVINGLHFGKYPPPPKGGDIS
jgi:hypothetical protein